MTRLLQLAVDLPGICQEDPFDVLCQAPQDSGNYLLIWLYARWSLLSPCFFWYHVHALDRTKTPAEWLNPPSLRIYCNSPAYLDVDRRRQWHWGSTLCRSIRTRVDPCSPQLNKPQQDSRTSENGSWQSQNLSSDIRHLVLLNYLASRYALWYHWDTGADTDHMQSAMTTITPGAWSWPLHYMPARSKFASWWCAWSHRMLYSDRTSPGYETWHASLHRRQKNVQGCKILLVNWCLGKQKLVHTYQVSFPIPHTCHAPETSVNLEGPSGCTELLPASILESAKRNPSKSSGCG